MNKSTPLVLILITLFFSVNGQEIPKFSKTDLIIKFKSDIRFDKENCTSRNQFNINKLDALNQSQGMDQVIITGNRKLKNAYCLQFEEEKDIYELIKMYKDTELFEYVEPNYIGEGHSIIPNDQFFLRQYGLLNNGNGQTAVEDADIDMDEAWEIEQGDESILIAVLDSGLKLDHPEFEGRLWVNEDELDGNVDMDGNGFRGDHLGWDFVNNDNDPTDDHGHGTNVAGIAAATGNNSIGYAGVDWNCKIMTCKILRENNTGLYSWWTSAIYYAVDNGARVLNMSVGGSGYSFSMQEAVNYAFANDVTIVVSMGNENRLAPGYPAGYDSTIGVGSTNDNDVRTEPFFWSATSGSNYGDHIDVVAPGNFIYGLSYTSNSNYNGYWGGTSQAAPLVTGLASLLLAQDPNRTPDEIRWLIRRNAEDQVGDPTQDKAGYDIYYGYGRINAFDTLNDSPATSTDNEEDKSNLSTYPNPSSGIFTVELDGEMDEVMLFDIGGNTKMRFQGLKNRKELLADCSALPNGVYILQAMNNDTGSNIVGKVVIER